MREVIVTGKTVEEATEQGCQQLGLPRAEVSVEILEMPQRKLFKTLPAKVRVSVEEPEDTTPAPAPAAPAPQKAAEKPAEKPVEKSGKNTPEKQAEKPAAQKPKKAVLPEEPEVAIDLAQNAPAKAAVDYLAEIFAAMGGPNVQITAWQQGDATLLRVEGDELANLLETRGDTVQALSYLTDRSVNKGVDKKDPAYLRVRLDIAGYRNRRENELILLATRTGEEVQRTKRSRTLAPMNPYERLIVHTTISGMEGLISESIGSDAERRVVIKSTAPDATDGEDWRPPRRNDRGRGNSNNRRGNNRHNDRGPRGGNDRGPRGGNSGGPRRDRNDGAPRTNTPEREYADKPRDPNAAPVVPERRDAVRDGEDLPLYGKIEI